MEKCRQCTNATCMWPDLSAGPSPATLITSAITLVDDIGLVAGIHVWLQGAPSRVLYGVNHLRRLRTRQVRDLPHRMIRAFSTCWLTVIPDITAASGLKWSAGGGTQGGGTRRTRSPGRGDDHTCKRAERINEPKGTRPLLSLMRIAT